MFALAHINAEEDIGLSAIADHGHFSSVEHGFQHAGLAAVSELGIHVTNGLTYYFCPAPISDVSGTFKPR